MWMFGPYEYLGCEAFQLAILADAVLLAESAPELGPHLVATLACLKADNLARHLETCGVDDIKSLVRSRCGSCPSFLVAPQHL